MKAFCTCLVAAILSGCTSGEEPAYIATADIDLHRVPAVLQAIDRELGGTLDVPAMTTLTESVSLDDEKQMDMEVVYKNKTTRLYYHVWREQPDWVHLYLSSPTEALIGVLEPRLAAHARAAEQDDE